VNATHAGNYIATYTASNGAKGSQTFVVVVNTVNTSIVTTPSTTIDAGASAVITVANNASYQWYKDNAIISNSTNSLTTYTAGTYQVKVSNTAGCSAISNSVVIKINPNSLKTFWHFENSLENWNGVNQMTSTISNSIASMTITGTDPYMHSPNYLSLPTNIFKYVVVSMQNVSSSNTAELFWVTDTDGTYNGSKRVSFPIVPNDTKQRYYIIDLSTNPSWTGTIKQIRIDPTTNVTSGSARIDFIKLIGTNLNTPAAIPGTIEIEDFNKGGKGNAYLDTDVTNNGGQYRTTEEVDIQTCGEGGYNVGWTAKGEWMEYLVNVTKSANYDFILRVASGTNGNKFHLEIDGEMITSVSTVNLLGGLQQYVDVKATVNLTQGQHLLKFVVDDAFGGFNLNKMIFKEAVTTHTQNGQQSALISIYPNPAKDILNIEVMGGLGNTPFEIRNVLGQLVYTSQISGNEYMLSLSNFSEGVYLLSIQNQVYKIIVEK
jgi:hypothetical protein